MYVKVANEIVIRKYETFLKEKKGYAEDTIDQYRVAVRNFQSIIGNVDLKKLNQSTILKFKNEMRNRNKMRIVSDHMFARGIQKVAIFISWLVEQPGFKRLSSIDGYLELTKEEKAKASGASLKAFPTLEELKSLVAVMPRTNAAEWRDRMVIVLLCSFPIRQTALKSLTLQTFVTEKNILLQDPKLGADTKHSTNIVSYIFEIIPGLRNEIYEWINYLKSIGFRPDSPVLPALKMRKVTGRFSNSKSTDVFDKKITNKGVVSKIIATAAKKSGVKYRNPHAFRHALAYELLKRAHSGLDVKMLSQCFGHKTIRELMETYGNLNEQQFVAVGKGFDERFKDATYRGLFVS